MPAQHKVENDVVVLKNGFEISLKIDDGYLLGIGDVRFCGRHLRNGNYTIRPFLKSIDGLSFDRFKLVDVKIENDIVRVYTQVTPTLAAELQWQDVFNHEFVTVPRPDGFASAEEFVLEFGEYTQDVYGKQVPGFYYSFELKSQAEFHSYIEQGTWEIDQLSKPVTIIAQCAGRLPWEAAVGREDIFYTHESQAVARNGGSDSVSQAREGISMPNETVLWQMMPRASGSQTFDFQATSDGWLAMYNPVPAYIQSCLRKEAGSEIVAHLERYYFPRRCGVGSGKKVLLAYFPEEKLSNEQIRDDWSDVYDTVNGLWRSHFNYPEDRSDTIYSPTMWEPVLEADPQAYRRSIKMIPKLAEYGVKRLYLGPFYKSHHSEKILEQSPCHILEYIIPERLGGESLLREIADEAHEYNMELYVWCLGAISRSSPIHANHPDWRCMDRNGEPLVTLRHPVLYAMDYNTGIEDITKATITNHGSDDQVWLN